METITISLKNVKVDSDFNARHIMSDKEGEKAGQDAKAAKTIEALATLIKKDGQLTPVHVQKRKDGKYDLRMGFRRVAALKALKRENVAAVIVEYKSKMDAYLANLKENMARKDLTSAEIAGRCAMLLKDNDKLRKGGKAKKGTTATLANELGIGHRYLNRLIRVQNECHPRILKAWLAGDGRCVLRDLEKWASVAHAEQLRLFNEAGGESTGNGAGADTGAGAGTGTGARAGQEQKPKRANNQLIELAIQATNGAKVDTRYKQGIIAALQWVLGDADRIPSVFDPRTIAEAKAYAKKKAEEEKAKENKAKRKAALKKKLAELEADGE